MKNKKIVAHSILGISALSVMLFPVGRVNALDYLNKANYKCTETEEHKAWAKLPKKERMKTYEPVKCYETVKTGSKIVKTTKSRNVKGTFPAVYDLRNVNGNNYVTPVKNQIMSNNKDSNSCWAFTTNALVESNYLLNGGSTVDLSERHMGFNMLKKLKDNTTNPYGYVGHTISTDGVDSGGNYFMSGYYLMSNRGPVLDSKVPITTFNSSKANTLDLKPAYNVDETYYLISEDMSYSHGCPDNTINQIKSLITEHGAVGSLMIGSLEYLAQDKASFYYSGTEDAGHAMTIIGWDDNYSKNNFKTTPSRDGAWIIKNTYPDYMQIDNNQKGYHYISYDDALVCDLTFAVDEVNTNVADNTYLISKHGWGGNIIQSTGQAMLFKINYTKKNANAEILKSVSVFGNAGDEVDIYYSDVDNVDEAYKIGTLTFDTLGSKTLTLNNDIKITSNKYYIYLGYKSHNSGTSQGSTVYYYPVDLPELTDTSNPYYMSSSEITRGESFYYADGGFVDTASVSDFIFYPVVSVTTNNLSYTVNAGDPTPTTGDVVDTNGGTFFVPVTVNNVELSELSIVIKNVSNVNSTNKFNVTRKSNGFEIAVKPGVTAAGTYTVTFSYQGVSSSKQFVVVQGTDDEEPPVLVSTITIKANDNATEVSVNGTLQLSATIAPANANNALVEWESSDNTIARVDQTGKVTGVKAGVVTITARALDGSGVVGTKQITVIDIDAQEGNGTTPPVNPDEPNKPNVTNPDEKENNPKTGVSIPIVASIVVVITSIGAYIVNKKHDLLKHFK